MDPRRRSPRSIRIEPDWQRRITRFLDADEELLWAGHPDKTLAMVRHLPLIAVVMLVVAVLLIGVTWLSWDDIGQGNLGAILLSGSLLLIFLGLPLAMLWHRRQAGKTCYALTSRRAIVFQPSLLGRLRVNSYFPKDLRNATYERSRWFGSPAGDWVFRKQVTKHTKRTINERSPLPDKVEVSYSVKTWGFLMLRDALAIESLLHAVARGEATTYESER